MCLQSMTLKEACKESLVILKQVMEEKLNATNVEVSHCPGQEVCYIIHNLGTLFAQGAMVESFVIVVTQNIMFLIARRQACINTMHCGIDCRWNFN